MTSTNPNEHLANVLGKGVLSELFRAEQYLALLRVIVENAPAINQTRAVYLFGEFQFLFAREIALALTKAFEHPKGFPIRSIPVALSILKEHANDLRITRRDFLVRKLVGYGLDEAQLTGMTDVQITQEVHKYFSGNIPKIKSSDDLSQALIALTGIRNKTIAHHEAVEFSTIPITTFKHIDELIGYIRKFLEVVGNSYIERPYSNDSDWFSDKKHSEELTSDLKWVLERADLAVK